MSTKRLMTFVLLAVCCLLVPRPAAATAITESSLDFSGLLIAPATGSLTLSDAWLLQAFGSVNNSLGESDMQFDFTSSPGTVTQTANVTWTTASGTATALGNPPDLDVAGAAASMVSISALGSNAAFATGTGNLSDCFTLSATTQTVDVRFGVNVSGLLQAFTDALGLVASSETTFSLQVDGNPVLFYDQSLQIGPNDSQARNFSTQLTKTVALDPSVQHCMVLEADSESQAQTTVSEPASSALLLAGLVALALLRRQSSTQKRTNRART